MIELVTGVDVGLKYHARATMKKTEGGYWRLHDAVLAKEIGPLEMECDGLPFEWRLIIECATTRPRDGATKKKEVDALNRAAGRLGALHPCPVFLLPEQWKNQTPKKIDQERTLAALSPEEKTLLPTKKAELRHVLDAVAIALKAVGRR